MTDEDIEALCKNCVELLQIIDSINTISLGWYWDKEDEETKKALQDLKNLNRRALQMVREMKMSVTPKWTLQEDHVDKHQEFLIDGGWGGEVFLDESFVEHEHQTGVKEDRRTQALSSFKARQEAQMKSIHRSSNPSVQEASLERKRPKRTRENAKTSTKKEQKLEYRQQATNKAAAAAADDDGDETTGA